jgi:hypothetical protein
MKERGNATQLSARRCAEYIRVTVVRHMFGPRIGFRNVLDEALDSDVVK